MNIKEAALLLHKTHRGKFSVVSKVPVTSKEELSLAYSPGVAAPCLQIAADPESVYEYTAKGNLVAVVTNGTAVLGLGDIGAEAAMPVMEGKAILFKEFGGVDAVPICLNSKDPDEIVRAVELMAPTFGGINLEDIKAPECFYIEDKLKASLDIPVFHDDQHGTAVVVLAGLRNAAKLVGKELADLNVVINVRELQVRLCQASFKRRSEKHRRTGSHRSIHVDRSNLGDAKPNWQNFCPRGPKLGKRARRADCFIGFPARSPHSGNDQIDESGPDHLCSSQPRSGD